jgi:hypothetical protein
MIHEHAQWSRRRNDRVKVWRGNALKQVNRPKNPGRISRAIGQAAVAFFRTEQQIGAPVTRG